MSEAPEDPFAPPSAEGPPPEPLAVPTIPRGRLWACLLVPAGMTLLSVLLVVPGSMSGSYDALAWLIGTLFVGPVAGLCCTPWWVRLMRIRYAKSSLVLLGIAYPLGQLILTPAIAYGGCFLTFAVFNG